jgi:kinesin family protein 5
LIARNDRILSLEQLLQDAQEKLINQNHKFEGQLRAARERLQQASQQKQQAGQIVNSGRVAKPIRGGGAGAVVHQDESVPASPAEKNKRTSWISGIIGSR